MDYKDYQAGTSKEHFWFKAKKQLIENLLMRVIKHRAAWFNPSSPGYNETGISACAHQRPIILDIGAGTGDDIEVLNKFGKVHVIDINQQALDLIPYHLVAEKKLGDACGITYPNNTFDIVIAFDVLEHIEHDAMAVSEINRVLKPGGYFVFTVPAYQFLYSAHDRYLNHMRRYNKKTVTTLLTPLYKIKLGYWNSILFLPAMLHRLITIKNEASPNASYNPSTPINRFLYRIMAIENWMMVNHINFPWGLSLYGIYQKSTTERVS